VKGNLFSFKTFKLLNETTAFKINTDGVLLGAWVDYSQTKKLLDVGTAGGVLAFIARHKAPNCEITGLDIDAESIKEANQNLVLNDSSKIEFIHISIQEFTIKNKNKYDTIVSNPPFFLEGKATELSSRKHIAKHQIRLSAEDLIHCSDKMLSPNGQFYCIYPQSMKEEILNLINESNLSLRRILHIKGKVGSPVSRLIFHATKSIPRQIQHFDLSIRRLEGKQALYTQEYINLTKDLYLNF